MRLSRRAPVRAGTGRRLRTIRGQIPGTWSTSIEATESWDKPLYLVKVQFQAGRLPAELAEWSPPSSGGSLVLGRARTIWGALTDAERRLPELLQAMRCPSCGRMYRHGLAEVRDLHPPHDAHARRSG